MARVVSVALLFGLLVGCGRSTQDGNTPPAGATAPGDPNAPTSATPPEDPHAPAGTTAPGDPNVSAGAPAGAVSPPGVNHPISPHVLKALGGRTIPWDPTRHPYLTTSKAIIRLKNMIRFQQHYAIHGGRKAAAGEWPWAALALDNYGGGFYFPHCGGALIAEGWVLTSAHCFVDPNDLLVIGEQEITPLSRTTRIAKVCGHPQFDSITHENDIALVKLVEPMIGAACLPYETSAPPSARSGNATVVGWGSTEDRADFSPSLLAVEVPFVPDADCRGVHGASLPAGLFCGGLQAGGKGFCGGDSGGPLAVHDSSSGTWLEVGIATVGCSTPDSYDLYTGVAPLAPWILQTMTSENPTCLE